MVSPAAFVRTLIVAAFAAVLAFAPAQAQQVVTVTTTTVTWTYNDAGNEDGADDIDEDAALLDDEALAEDADFAATRRYAPAPTLATLGRARATYGPFSVIDANTVRMAGDVTSATPRQFAAMLAAFPGLKRLEMIDCPGSLDEEANLILARAIRRAGMETVVPAGGSIRSGAVELWLAGTTRRAAPDAEFGVHSWADEYGREANDYPANDPVHAEYLGYYREMGLNDARARAFYALTNSTPFDEVRYLTRDDMARFVTLN
ncbi:MAG: alpha/beta hydrolase [Sphingopyxis sp.]|nr:alpha/beta hydrolase [Sphingopyxis sp.]